MSRFDRFDPSEPRPAPSTGGSVRVIVHDRPARAPTWEEPEPPRRFPDVIIVPEKQLAEDRDAFIASLDARWGGFIEKELSRRKDVAKASRPDVHQAVLVILSNHYVNERKAGKSGALDHESAFLDKVINNAVMNHASKKKRRPRLDQAADVDEQLDAGPDPEQATLRAELLEKIERYRSELTEEELEVFEAREIDRMTFEMIAAILQRPLSTVVNQHKRAVAKLREAARASERGTALARRKPGGGFRNSLVNFPKTRT